MTVRVLVVDDQALLRTAFRTLIDAEPDLEVVGEAADGQAAVRAAAALHPDVVLMDVRMPVLDGISATRIITSQPKPAPRVLVLTTFDDDATVFDALEAGAAGFTVKAAELEELLVAVRVVAAGDSLLSPDVTRRLIERYVQLTPVPEPEARGPLLGLLSDRERDVLLLVAEGATNAEIAARLQVSLPTAKTHVSRILTKLDARDRVQLVIIAYQQGLVRP